MTGRSSKSVQRVPAVPSTSCLYLLVLYAPASLSPTWADVAGSSTRQASRADHHQHHHRQQQQQHRGLRYTLTCHGVLGTPRRVPVAGRGRVRSRQAVARACGPWSGVGSVGGARIQIATVLVVRTYHSEIKVRVLSATHGNPPPTGIPLGGDLFAQKAEHANPSPLEVGAKPGSTEHRAS